MGTTVKVVGSMVILVILFGLVSSDSGVTPTLTTPTPSSVTTTPEDSNDCGSDGLPAFETVERRRRVQSGRECQEYCAGIQEAEYFKWKKTGVKVCSCIKPVVKPRDNFEGGPVFC